MLNILSASSKTAYVVLTKFVAFFLTISMSLPGVAISISTPAFNSFHYSCLDSPPNKAPTLLIHNNIEIL